MLVKLGDPSIDPQDPWGGDVLDRKEFGQTLAAMIGAVAQPFVISVKGEWGSGKSVFLRRLRCHLEGLNSPIPVVHVDAWKSDHYEDPIYALISAVNARLDADRAMNASLSDRATLITRELFESATKAVAPLMKIAGAAIDLGTGGAVSNLMGGAGDLGAALLVANDEKTDAQARFYKALQEARNELLGRHRQATPRPLGDKKIVIMIDELDRCRPDYAIRLLERIKHFFDITGILFVIAVDGKNLHHAVNSLYGSSIESEVYLRKFFDIELYLPKPSTQGFNSFLRQAFSVGVGTKFDGGDWGELQSHFFSPRFYPSPHHKLAMVEASAYFEVIAEAYELQLRDQAQAFSRLHACVLAAGNNQFFLPFAASLIVCLRYHRHGVYEAWRTSLNSPSLLPRNNQEIISSIDRVSPRVARIIKAYLSICESATPEHISRFYTNRPEEDKDAVHVLLQRLPENSRSALRAIRQSYESVFAVSGMLEDRS